MYFHNGGKSRQDYSTDGVSQFPIEMYITPQYGRQDDFYNSKSYWLVREI
jgi:hypothetical protein